MNNDLISRKALKKAVENLVAGGEERLKDYYENGSKSEENEWIGGVYDVWELIDNAPTVEQFDDTELQRAVGYADGYSKGREERPQGEWIPVSERLPEGKIDPTTNDFELVLCSTVWEVVRPYKFGKPIGHSEAHFWRGSGIMDDYVIAWKPMPEPYKGVENE